MNHHEPRLELLVDEAIPETVPPFGDVLARRARRRTRRRAAVAGVASIAVVAAVAAGSTLLDNGTDSGLDPAPAPTVTDTNSTPAPEQVAPDWDGEGVPPLTLLLADRMVVLAPWSYCYGNVCVDGVYPEHLDHVGSPETVEFSFPVPDWKFEVTFTEVGVPRPRSVTTRATATSDTTFQITPEVDPGTYNVDLFGRGDGDVSYAFRWTTPD